jgi:hypothetical protein
MSYPAKGLIDRVRSQDSQFFARVSGFNLLVSQFVELTHFEVALLNPGEGK